MTDEIRDRLQSALRGSYEIERELGGGGMSRVFVATESALGRAVVIEVVAPGLLEGLSADRFTREVKVAARLQQANIVPLLSAGDAGGVPFYTMPFVDGLSLRARLTSAGPMPLAEATHVLRDVAKALAYAHQNGVVHRDIKPENVLLSGGTAMVIDFGIAKALRAAHEVPARIEETVAPSDFATLTSVGSSLGTPAYMAPEQAVGSIVDLRADLYAWGMMAYELLAGAHPFAGRTTMQALVAAQIAELPAPLASKNTSIPQPLADVVMRCLEKDPANRPASATEILSALDQASTPTPHVIPASVVRTRRRGPIIALAVVAIAVLGVVFARWRTRAPSATGDAASAANTVARSIAVLPLANLGGDKSDDYFGIGLAEEMTRALSKTGVRVIGRVSASMLLAKGLDDRAVAKELGVGSLLTGSVQHAGDQVRINVSLIDASDGAVRWTERYDRPLTNVFAVQDEIARTVASKLLGALGGSRSPVARVETADAEAYSLYLQGQVLLSRRTAQTIGQAISLFERALARDSTFARAQAALAMAFVVTPSYVQGQTDAYAERGRSAARRAIALDSTIAESHTALAYAEMFANHNHDADREFRIGVALDSTSATAWGWWALLASKLGDFDTAHRRAARARELEPASMIARTWETQTWINARRYATADSLAHEAMAFDSTFVAMSSTYAVSCILQGRTVEALAILEGRVADLPPRPPTAMHALLALAYARAGMTAKARASIESQRAKGSGTLPASGSIAAALAELGDQDAALAVLDRAVTQHEAWLVQYLRSAQYDKLRRDPRGAAIIARAEAW